MHLMTKVVRSRWRKEWIKNDPDLTSLRENARISAIASLTPSNAPFILRGKRISRPL